MVVATLFYNEYGERITQDFHSQSHSALDSGYFAALSGGNGRTS